MPGGPRMEYSSEQLRQGGRLDRASAEGATGAAQQLDGAAALDASVFGDVGSAASFAAQARMTKQDQADGATGAATHRDDQGVRADSVAAGGDRLKVDTGAMARSATPPGVA